MHKKPITALRACNRVLAPAILAGLLASCGGGGGGGSAAPAVANSLGISTATDTATAALGGNGLGQWDGAGGGGGSDGGGGAGDGEFVQFNFNPTTLKFTWKVLKSEYGIAGQTGSMDLVADSNKGGYRDAGNTALNNRGNIYVSTSGQVSGSLPFTIGGNTVYMLFNGMRYKDTVSSLAHAAGDYLYGMSSRQANNGASPETEWGTMRINADGTGRVCSQSSYSDTCSNGFSVSFAYDDPANPMVLKMTSSDSRDIKAYMLTRRNANNVNTATIDISFTTNSGNRRTGAIYAMQMTGTYNPNAIAGAWTHVGTDPLGPRNTSTGFLRIFNSGTQYVQHDTVGGTDCVNPSFNDSGVSGVASSFPGMGYIQNTGGGPIGYLLPLSADMFVVAQVSGSNGGGLAVARKYSTSTTANGGTIPC